jgi:hypothetical protein
MNDLFIRSNRAVSVEPNLIAGKNDMNNGHVRHYLCHQKSLPDDSTMSQSFDKVWSK